MNLFVVLKVQVKKLWHHCDSDVTMNSGADWPLWQCGTCHRAQHSGGPQALRKKEKKERKKEKYTLSNFIERMEI